MPRMKILNSVEREVFDWPPIFNSVERKAGTKAPLPAQPNPPTSSGQEDHLTSSHSSVSKLFEAYSRRNWVTLSSFDQTL